MLTAFCIYVHTRRSVQIYGSFQKFLNKKEGRGCLKTLLNYFTPKLPKQCYFSCLYKEIYIFINFCVGVEGFILEFFECQAMQDLKRIYSVTQEISHSLEHIIPAITTPINKIKATIVMMEQGFRKNHIIWSK